MRKSMNEHIQRIKYLNGYALNESPVYSLVDGIEEDDMPDFMQKVAPVTAHTSEAADDEDTVDNLAAGEGVPEPAEAGDDTNALEDPMAEPAPEEAPAEDPMAEPAPEMAVEPEMEEPSPDEIQNEIIKTNIDVMKQLNQKIEDLETMAQSLTMQNMKMEKEVDEVREPTNVEKLVTKKEDSHPYYFGLNDMWKGNWFQARRDEMEETGMKQAEDGSYVADFDELPQMSSHDVKDSFNDY